jgi:hypothetical protein
MPATETTEYRDGLHSVALPRMRHKGSSRYRWWLLAAAAVAIAVAAASALWR